MRRRVGNESQGIEEFIDDDAGALSDHPHVHGFLPDDHPHPQLYHGVTPIWHDGESPEDLDDRFGEAYSCGFGTGFERGIVMVMMKPEWAVGWYRALREYYLVSNHAPEDLQSWERCAEETARAIPVTVWSSTDWRIGQTPDENPATLTASDRPEVVEPTRKLR